MKLSNIKTKQSDIHKTNFSVKNTIPYILLFCIFAFTRLWELTHLPMGLHIDEAGTAYDGFCLANFGVDRYLKSWPVYFLNYGGGQNALYTWVCAVLFKFFGYSVGVLRFPAVFSSFLAFFFGMKIMKKIHPENRLLPLATGALIAVSPCLIMAGRFGLESNLMLGFSTMFLYCFLCALESGRKIHYVLAGISGGLVLYTYALSYIILPLFLAVCLIYTIRTHRFSFTRWAVMAVPMAVLALPLILVQIVNAFDLPEFRLGIFTITKFSIYRVSEINRISLGQFLQVLRSIFVGDSLPYNSIGGIWNLYFPTALLCAAGIFRLGKKTVAAAGSRTYHPGALVLFWFLSSLLFLSHIETNVNKVNGTFVVTIILAAEGAGLLCTYAQKVLKKAYIMPFVLSLVYALCFLRFSVFYFGSSYKQLAPLDYFDCTVTEAVNYIKEDEELRNRTTYMAESATYFALSSQISPYELDTFYAGSYTGSCGSYVFSTLGEIEESANYIVRDIYVDYSDELRNLGFTEIPYEGYSLFYHR